MKKDIRRKFRNDVFERDECKCKMCGDSNSKLDAHHITDRSEMPNGGYVKENGITLCDKPNGCHVKAEMYHKYTLDELHKRNLTHYKNQEYSPENLYKKINSSYSGCGLIILLNMIDYLTGLLLMTYGLLKIISFYLLKR